MKRECGSEMKVRYIHRFEWACNSIIKKCTNCCMFQENVPSQTVLPYKT